jgi:hypothetical protein
MLQFPPLSHSSWHCSICSWCIHTRLRFIYCSHTQHLSHWLQHYILIMQKARGNHCIKKIPQVSVVHENYRKSILTIENKYHYYILIYIQKYNKTYIVIMYSPNWEVLLWFRKYVESENRRQYKSFESIRQPYQVNGTGCGRSKSNNVCGLRNNTQEGLWDKYDPHGQGPMSLVW